jgi:hypothetical protein
MIPKFQNKGKVIMMALQYVEKKIKEISRRQMTVNTFMLIIAVCIYGTAGSLEANTISGTMFFVQLGALAALAYIAYAYNCYLERRKNEFMKFYKKNI